MRIQREGRYVDKRCRETNRFNSIVTSTDSSDIIIWYDCTVYVNISIGPEYVTLFGISLMKNLSFGVGLNKI